MCVYVCGQCIFHCLTLSKSVSFFHIFLFHFSREAFCLFARCSHFSICLSNHEVCFATCPGRPVFFYIRALCNRVCFAPTVLNVFIW